MRRLTVTFAALLLLLSASIVTGFGSSRALAQDSATAGHALVGTWLADTDTDDPANPPSLFIFHSDGTYLQVDADGTVGVGVWTAESDSTAILNAWIMGTDENDDFAGMVVVRASITLADDGESFTAEYTLEFVDPSGGASGQAGPGNVAGQKLSAEPMGVPVMSLSDMFGPSDDPSNSMDEEDHASGGDDHGTPSADDDSEDDQSGDDEGDDSGDDEGDDSGDDAPDATPVT